MTGMATTSTIAAMPLTDEQLAAIIRERDRSADHWRSAQEACAELYQRHARLLLAFLASRGQRANLDDLHQSVWERVWRYLPESFSGGNFRAWLYQIARSRVIDEARKQRPERLADTDPPDLRAEKSCHEMMDQEQMAILQHCLEQLAERAARVVRAVCPGWITRRSAGNLGYRRLRPTSCFTRPRVSYTNA